MRFKCQSCGKGEQSNEIVLGYKNGVKVVTYRPYRIFLCEECHDKISGKKPSHHLARSGDMMGLYVTA